MIKTTDSVFEDAEATTQPRVFMLLVKCVKDGIKCQLNTTKSSDG